MSALVRWKIAALLQTFGLSVGSCGFANVLQCALVDDRSES